MKCVLGEKRLLCKYVPGNVRKEGGGAKQHSAYKNKLSLGGETERFPLKIRNTDVVLYTVKGTLQI